MTNILSGWLWFAPPAAARFPLPTAKNMPLTGLSRRVGAGEPLLRQRLRWIVTAAAAWRDRVVVVIGEAVDTGAGSTFNVIATAAPFTRFRGLAPTAEPTSTTETLAPTSESINLGKGTAGNLASWAADDGDMRRICKFIVPSLSSPFIRTALNYTTTKTTPTAIDFVVKAKMVHGGAFKIRLFVQNKVSSVFDQVLADTTINLGGATYTGSAGGTLTDYVGAAGAMTGRIEIQQTGPAAVTLPCTDFEFANMKVTG